MQGIGPMHGYAQPMDFGNYRAGGQVSLWFTLAHSQFNVCAVFEATIKHETPTNIVDPIHSQLLGAIQSLQQQVIVINQQLAGLYVQCCS